MIKRISSTDERFRPVEFTPGFNIVLAERTQESTKNDSCNGLGKSTLIEVIHFLLGASKQSIASLLVPELQDWMFTMDLSFGSRELQISRSLERPARVQVKGDIPDGFPQGFIGLNEWTNMLGFLAFGLDTQEENSPTFRGLISYFIRRGIGAFLSPFDSFAKMKSYQRQLNTSFLLGLDWRIAAAWETINSRSGVINQMRREAKAGTLIGIERKLSELEVTKVRLEREVKLQATQLADFKVHPQYREIEEETSRLTSQIHDASNSNFQDRRIISLYWDSLEGEQEASPVIVEEMYKEAGLAFPDQVKVELDKVLQFHKKVAQNRKAYLNQELDRLNRSVRLRDEQIEKLTTKRAELLQILRTYGALEEHTALQRRHLELKGELDEVVRQIEVLKKIELGKVSIDIDKATLSQRALTSLEEHSEQRGQAIGAFDSYVRELYDRPGSLIINIDRNGYDFDTEIDRKGSQGIDFMTVFCYDWTLAQLWAAREYNPSLLVHDSTIFDGVDGRQHAHALELAARESERLAFQYICALNSDELPTSDFSEGFDYNDYVSHRLTDANVAGSLLGLRIESKEKPLTKD